MANGLQPLDILTPLQQGLAIRGQREQQERARGLAPLQQQQAQLALDTGALNLETGQEQLAGAREQARLKSLVIGSLQLQQTPDEQKLGFLQQRRQQLIDQGLPTMDTDEAIELAQAGDFETLNQIADSGVVVGERLGLLQRPDMAMRGVQSSQILGDGTTVQVLRSGETRVTDPEGNELKGKDRAAAIVAARQAEAEQQAARAGGRTKAQLEAELELQPTVAATEAAAEQAIKKSGEAFDRLEPIRGNIANLGEVVRLIDEGAQTGVIASKLPSVSEASLLLDNLQGRLGLDVVGNTTFGALSESELKFALDTALPKNLSPQALKQWAVNKQRSQQKLANYIQEVATFLGTPGNTVADFLQLKQAQQIEKEAAAVGAVSPPQNVTPPAGVVTEDAQLPEQLPGTTGQTQQIGRFTVEFDNG